MRQPILLLLSFVVFAASPAFAQSAKKREQHGQWGTYSYQAQNGDVCYVLTVPTDKQPPKLDHGDMYFFVAQRPGQSVSFEPQFISGYEMKTGSKVSVSIGSKTFTMFTKGKSAWVENAAEEPQMIAAMKSGSTMRVKAQSGRGNETNYTFSLSGITAALNSISNCK